MLKDYNEEQLAKFFLYHVENLKRNNGVSVGISYFEEEYPNINFEKLQQECEKLGYHIKQGNKIKNKSKFYSNSWNKRKTVFIFVEDENKI